MTKLLLIGVLLILLLGGFWQWNTQSRLYTIDAPLPDNFPAKGFSHHSLEKLLQQFVDPQGNVDYQRWKDSPDGQLNLNRYLAAVARFSPENSPGRFATGQHALAYWIYSYNALVIYSILHHWPLDSVTDIKAPVEVIKGLGFFYNQTFIIGGKSYNLYQLEQQKMVHSKADPRLHFVLNCASTSCPPMRPQLPVGVELEPFLQQAAVDFINNKKNVAVDAQCQTIRVSKIFDWYLDDFVRATDPAEDNKEHNKEHNKEDNKQRGLINYIKHFASGELKNTLATCGPFTLDYMNYDWSINKSTH